MDELNTVTFKLLDNNILLATNEVLGYGIKFDFKNVTAENVRGGMMKICGFIEKEWGEEVVYDNFNRICEEIVKQWKQES